MRKFGGMRLAGVWLGDRNKAEGGWMLISVLVVSSVIMRGPG